MDIKERIARLSPEQRRLLEEKLRSRIAASSGIPRRNHSGLSPLSFAQQRLWFLDQLEPGSPLYNIPYALRIDGELSVPALEAALQQILNRHEVLRTRFTQVDGTPMQAVFDAAFRMAFSDLSAWPEDRQQDELSRRMVDVARKPFNLSEDALLRATLFRMNERSHALLLVIHHIASDAWSFDVLFRELAEFYNAALEHRTPDVTPLPLQYADFAEWQRKAISGERLQSQLAFWKQQLSGVTPLQLPTDRPRPSLMTHGGARHTVTVDAAVMEKLQKLSRDNNASEFMLLLAAFSTLLSRYSGQKDMCIGSPIAGRQQVELERLIGFFVNTLVLRADLSGDPTFRELLGRVRERALGAYANQDVPFEKLVEELQPERDRGQNPLFQAAFVLQNAPFSGLRLNGATLTPLSIHDGTAKFDLMLMARETSEGLNCIFEYRTDIYDRPTIARMGEHFAQLLASIAANPDVSVSRLEYLTTPERHQLLVEWAEKRPAYPAQQSIASLFESQAERSPNALAVQYGDAVLTYADLNSRANALAHVLIEQGATTDMLIALCIERSIDMVVATLAILKAGGAYVPIDPSYPAERIAFMLDDTKAPLLITTRQHAQTLPPDAARVICIDDPALELSFRNGGNPAARSSGESLAYVIYTSGSTGKPKGICVLQKAVNRLVLNTDYCQLGPDDRVAQISNVSFDAATFELWGALLNGGALIGITRDIALSPADFVSSIRRERITAMFLTTALFNLLISENPRAFESVTHVLFGGEACDPRRIRECLRAAPPRRLLHVYGPTEVTTFSTWHEIVDVPADATTVPIGRPIANTEALILDSQRQPVAVGIPGEIYLGGDGLARGYLNRPELTAEKFVTHPFIEGARLYRSGDIGRFLPNGAIEFIGRVDHQVKIRGFRVELGEIESALCAHPAVKECVVVAREESSGSRRLVGYVVLKQQAPTGEIRQALASHLPDYMVPSAIISLDQLPLNSNGKVDRKKLPAPEASLEVVRQRVPAWMPLHQQLIEIWEELLGVTGIGIRESFFDLGGHSLLAVRMLSRVEQACGRKLPVSALYAANTIEKLADALLKESSHDASAPMFFNRNGKQRPLFFLHGDFTGGGLYCVSLARHLGEDQPVIALAPHGADGKTFTPDIRSMAAEHLRTIRSQQAHGPYRIAGFCAGGYVAYEVARQLTEQGHVVERVILIDVVPARPGARWVRSAVHGLGTLTRGTLQRQMRAFDRWIDRLQRFRNFTGASLSDKLTSTLSKAQKLARIPVLMDNGREIPATPAAQDVPRELSQAYRWAIAGYRPGRFAGTVCLLFSEDIATLENDPASGWRRAASTLHVRHVPGSHLSCITTHSRELAASISECLDAQQTASARVSLQTV